MCLAIPMKILKIEGDKAIVSSSGVQRNIGISFMKNMNLIILWLSLASS